MYYYVNRTNRLVRTEPDPISFPNWELVGLPEWEAFRAVTAKLKKAKKK